MRISDWSSDVCSSDLLAGQQISTVDNSRTFAPNIACQKTATMLEVVVQPSGTGDLGRVSIARDTDLDGTVDATSNLPVPVSGICANGEIGRASCRERVCQYVSISGVAVSLKNTKNETKSTELAL